MRNPSPSNVDITAHTDGKPFWLVLGQSHNRGWRARTGSHDLGAPTLVDGYANAWLIHPARAGTLHIGLEWTPQRYVWIAIAVSIAGIALCLVILLLTRRRRRARADPALADSPIWRWTLDGPRRSAATVILTMAATFIVTATVSRVSYAVIATLTLLLVTIVPRVVPLLGVAAAGLLMASRIGHRPELAWLALAVFAVAVVTTTHRETPADTP